MAETEEYAPDDFDEVPADSAHRGVYRAAAPAKAVSRRTTGAVILAGALALVLGALMFIYQPRSAAPEAQSESTQSEPVASASATASSGSSATEQAGASAQARRVAQDLGVTAVRASEEWSAQVTVVLTHG